MMRVLSLSLRHGLLAVDPSVVVRLSRGLWRELRFPPFLFTTTPILFLDLNSDEMTP